MSNEIKAADVLKENHPLNNPFRKWLQGKGDAPATKRQARKFLAILTSLAIQFEIYCSMSDDYCKLELNNLSSINNTFVISGPSLHHYFS